MYPLTESPITKISENDFKEVKMELSQAKDLLKNVVPAYRLRWKLSDESKSDVEKNSEKLLYRVKAVTAVVNLNVITQFCLN